VRVYYQSDTLSRRFEIFFLNPCLALLYLALPNLALPAYRVTVHADAVPFVLKGKTLFAKHVIDVDPSIRAMDEVLLVDLENNLLITGQALLSAAEMKDFNRGAAVAVRKGKG